ncbi:MAG: hypothetical protein QOF60_598 [Actinomycetota bacterium]|nr:hypothetical protein [Actinomycetota bacterium]
MNDIADPIRSARWEASSRADVARQRRRPDNRAPECTRPAVEMHRYKAGYNPPPALLPNIRNAEIPALGKAVIAASADLVTIIGVGALASTLPGGALGLLGASSAAAVIARSSRGLEALCHEASHKNWSRGRLNDILGNILAAIPVGTTVAHYRESHDRHHKYFGTSEDPDRMRYIELGIDELDRTRKAKFVLKVAAKLPSYIAGWFHSIGTSPLTGVATAIWHAAMFAAARGIAGTHVASTIWKLWLLALFVVLPVLRFLGEAAEHRYTEAHNEFDATISNLGFLHRRLVHPHNDGVHGVHHRFPNIPFHQLMRMHQFLISNDPDNYGALLPWRRRVLENPKIGMETT